MIYIEDNGFRDYYKPYAGLFDSVAEGRVLILSPWDYDAGKKHVTRAEWVAEYVFRNQMELWGEQMEQELTGALDTMTERGAASSLLVLLPQEFTTGDLIKLRARKGQSVSSASVRVLLHRWRVNGRIEKVSDGRFKRLK